MIKVLIVEDDPMVAALNRQYVEQIEGFVVGGVASDTDKAMEVLANTAIDLVLLDIHMPGLNGLGFLEWIRKQKEDLDVILITAASDIAQIQQALRLGAADYLIKPFEFSRFQDALQQYEINYRKLHGPKPFSQQELDGLFRRKTASQPEPARDQALPKGLTKTTLQTLNDIILLKGTEAFSTNDLADEVEISRVSVRKYLKFLTDIGYLAETLIYGVGRPIYQYQLNKEAIHRLKPYL